MAEPRAGDRAPRSFEIDGPPVLRGEEAGSGLPVVLCHGLTATRRYVVHGSRALERAGHRVIAYDARGHGESDPAPAGEGYGYPELVEDLERVLGATVGEEWFVLAGHSLGAHTAISHALGRPERLAGLVVIGPVYAGTADKEALAYWDGLAAALEAGGVDGFLDYIEGHQDIDPAWRDTIRRFTRERMLRHRDLEALAEAVRQSARSRPFGRLEELAAIDVPALVVGSHDAADGGHPLATARAYADQLPRARLIHEAEGESPLAWQGGKLAREIASFCAEPEVAGALGAGR
jgi:pimeloyl-ACP methyl ester carboxylesterase